MPAPSWRRAHLSMAAGVDQVGRRAVAVIVFLTCVVAGRGRAAAADEAVRRELSAECDALLADALKTPYGWGWAPGGERQKSAPGRGPRTATIDTRATAAAGLVLHLAGRRLNEPRYAAGAMQAARALAAVQANSGQIPATGVIRANAGGRDVPGSVPSRAATCAGLGLLLVLVRDAEASADGEDDGAGKVALVRGAALKGANWLGSQQVRLGGWPVAYPPDAPPGEGVRVIRLDTTEYRDATVVLLLAADVLGDERFRIRAQRAVSELITLRTWDEKSPGHLLWSTAYNLDETLHTKTEVLSPAIDAQASRTAMQTMVAGLVMGGDAEGVAPAVQEAAEALGKLPREKGLWRRRYDWDLRSPEEPPAGAEIEKAEEPSPESIFDVNSTGKREWEAAVGVDEVIRAARRLDKLGAEEYAKALDAQMPLSHRFALVVCGLDDEAITAEAAPRTVGASAGDEWEERLRGVVRLVWRDRLGPEPRAPTGENGENREGA